MDKKYKSKDNTRSEREKLRDMIFGEKIAYIWDYYRYYIIGGVFAIILITSVIYQYSTRPNVGLFVAWSAGFLEHEEVESLSAALEEHIFEANSNETADISFFFTNDDDPSYSIQYYNRLMAMLTAGTIDIFIVDMSTLLFYSSSEFIWPLDIVLNDIKASSPELYEVISKETVSTMFGSDDGDKTLEITAIRITDSPLMNKLGFVMENDAFFCMAISTQRIDRVAPALKMFFE